jgi:hypothetical protein
MTMKSRFGLAFVGLILALPAVGYSAEYNFFEQSGKAGCLSVITESGQSDCKTLQKAKDDACNVSVENDIDKHERSIRTYREAKERLDRGQVAVADKDKLAETVRLLKEQLDRAKEAAKQGMAMAQNCVDARERVQKWFEGTAIPLTERTRDDALRTRKNLLDKLADTQKKQADAKSNREANPRNSSAQSDYDRATEEMRNAEKALAQFNEKYGQEVERHASRLIEHYKAEKASHEKPLAESKNRVENCKKIVDMSY